MFASIEIENFRGIAKGKLEGLAPLSVLVGVNNSGKSTVLEALHLVGSQGHGLKLVLTRRGWLGLAGLGDIIKGEGRETTMSKFTCRFSDKHPITVSLSSPTTAIKGGVSHGIGEDFDINSPRLSLFADHAAKNP